MSETIAITNWNGIISPHYDACCNLMIVGSDDHRVLYKVRFLSTSQKAEICRKEGVSILICGAISTMAQAELTTRGIKVISWIRGPVEDIIRAYKRQVDVSRMFSMPGCHSKCQKRRRYGKGIHYDC